MYEPWRCTGGKHSAPATGGSCPCGMVTRVLAPKRPPAAAPPEVLALLAQYLDQWSESLGAAASRPLQELEAAASRLLGELEAAASRLLEEQADRMMAALSTTGPVPGAEGEERLVVPRMEAAQPAVLAHTAPRAAALEVVTPVIESAPATRSAGVTRAPSELDARRAEMVVAATASRHDTGEADTLRGPASGDASAPPRLFREGVGRDRSAGHVGKRARKKVAQKHRQQPSRTKRRTSADGVVLPPPARPADHLMGSPGMPREQGPALCEAV